MEVMLAGKVEILTDIVVPAFSGVQLTLVDLIKSLGFILDSSLLLENGEGGGTGLPNWRPPCCTERERCHAKPEPSKMDRIYSEINAEDDHTDHTVKRRISSILKVPRTPLRDLGGGNELIQGCNIEKRQKNSRRVSFADKIRVFPSDLQTNVESDHAEETTEARHQEPLSQNEKPETLQFEITGMNTLLHAPIQTPLQQMECHDINTCQEWNKMNRTLLFSEENEMDMTAGHTVMITHDIGTYEETDKPRKIDFKSFSTELKMNKENTEIHEFNNPTKVNERCLSQQNTNIGNTRKIKFDDFLKSLQSSKPSPTPAAEVSFLPSEVLERKICSSERNVSFHMQGKSNTTTVFGGLDNKTAVTQYCLSNTETIAPPTCHASKQTRCGGVTLHCRDESMDRTVANTERVLPADLSSLTGAKQHQNLEREKTVSYDSCQLKPSSYPSGIQHTAMCINNNGEAGVAKKCGVRLICKDASLPSNQEISVENKASTNLNSIPYDEMAASEQKAVYGNKELQNLSIKPGSSTSSHLERKENTLLVSLPCDKSAVFSAKGIDLNRNYVAKTERRQVGCQLPLSQTVVAEMNGITAVNYKTNEKSGCSSNKVPPISADKTIMFAASEDMELTKPTAYLIDKSLKAAGFYQKPQEEIRSGKHNIIGRASDKTVVFSLGEDNEMDITKSCTVAVNHNFMQRCERHPQVLPLQPVVLPLQPVEKTIVYASQNDMDTTKPNTCIIDQSLENAVHKLDKEADWRTIESSKDETVMFFCNDENEMEITRSHTVALNHDDVPQGDSIPIATHVPPDKTVMFTFSEDMEITRPVAYAIDKSLKSVTGSLDEPAQDTTDGKRRITGTASDKTVVFSLGEDNEMEITKSCTVAVNHDFMQHCENVPELLPLQPDKTVAYTSHNDMDMTKPVIGIIDQSVENAAAQGVHKLDKEADWRTPIESTKDKTVVFFFSDENEMEISRSHTVTVNHDTIQHIGGAPQAQSLFPAERTYVLVRNSNMSVNKPTSFIPADKIMMVIPNNDKEITKPVGHVMDSSQKSKEKETDKVMLPELIKQETVAFLLHEDNEMEITKVAVNHDIQQMEEAPQELSIIPAEKTKVSGQNSNMATGFVPADKILMCMHSNNMEISKPLTDASLKNTSSKALAQEGTETKKAMLSGPVKGNAIIVKLHDNEMEVTKCHTIEVNHDIFSQCERRSLVQFNQDIDITGSHNDMKSMHGVTQDIDITKNHTANIYDPNCYIPKLKKQLLNSLKKPREKTTAFSDGETMEITRNHTTGIEFMNKNNCNNEHSSCSQAKSEFPPLVVPHEKELAVIKTDKHTPEKSLSSYNVKLPIPVNNVNKQNLLRIQENQLETQPSGINKLAEVASNDVHCSAENEYMLPVEMLVQNPKSCDETALNLNTERICMLVTETENLKDYPEKLSLIRHESTLTGETKSLPVAGTATKIEKAVLCELGHVTKDRQTNLDPPINNFCSEEDPVLLPKVPGINDCSKLINIGKTSETGLMSQNARPSLGGEPMMKPKELKEGFRIESSNYVSNELKSKTFTEGDPFHVPFNPMQKNNCQIKKLPLGIFPPKLPNKRKSTIANVEDTGERTKPQDSQNSLLIMKVSDKITQHLSPSHYIGEELLPPCIEEMDFSELLSCELLEKVCDVMDEKEITNNGHLKETCRQKRDRDQEGEELQNEKKLKVYEGWSDTTELKQPFPSTIVTNEETLEGKNAQDVMASNMERTHSSNGSSLDSTKADSDLSNQRNAEIETELLMDSICEQNLHEKLQEGVITVREFFTLLQVHVLIQKPRQSLLPPKYIANSSPAPEDLILSQYIDHPKLQMYNEDCQALSEIIEELKLCADNQDKLLVNVNKSLWEVMRTCSDEELKEFGAELNKMKSCFAKKSKTLAHRGKAKLYMKLVQNAQLQWEKLQSRLNKMDELFKEMDIYLVALEAETAKLEDLGLGVSDSVTDYESKLRQTEQELENYKAQEEALQRDQSNLRGQQQQRVSEISHLQEEAKSCQEQMEKYNFSEWVMKEWNDEQAVFTFLCDSVELTVTLGCPVAASAAVVTTKKLYRQIVGVNIESLLDEAKAPASSKLVQKLIFQFINDQSSWQEKYSTVTHLAQLLHDLSLVVSRCQLLGEEIEFLNRWGGKFSLLKTAVNDTKVKLLFSSSLAFAKFEVELSLSANYPTSPVVFTVQKYTGNLGQEEISEVLSGVPVGANYLTRMVNQIHHRLLQNPSTIHKQQK
ncbi:kinetochore scaffold 1 [Eublepharis macularius]|uniref:Kinetochore scaffold 1 n=1 Tax=Eublepharis macularius TaxID=481883 RepID=A0AA97IUM7_EUBMA|nr:kinetochore scaffold 1 [Eublepharis macularius]